MIRNILIIDESSTFRKTLRSIILSHYEDVSVEEASTFDEITTQLSNSFYHIVFFSWHVEGVVWHELFKLESLKHTQTIFVLLTPNESREYVRKAEELGVSHRLIVPSHHDDVTSIIDTLCAPESLRRNCRYSVAKMSVVLAQNDRQYEGQVVNLSVGGILCEINNPAGYDWSIPVVISMHPSENNNFLSTVKLESILVRLKVIASLGDDNVPKSVRIAYRFMSVGRQQEAQLEKFFKYIESNKDTLG